MTTSAHDRAVALDAADPLASFRDEFVDVEPEVLYVDGNSLGRMPIAAREIVSDVTERQWSDRLIRSWGEGWWEMQLRLGEMLAPIVGARPDELIISDSTSVNLYKLAGAALAARPDRSKIVTDDMNFPTDLYILDGLVQTMGRNHEVIIVKSEAGLGPVDDLIAAMDEDTALVTLTHTVFKSGYTYDMARISEAAHAVGALVLFDVSHSVGSVAFSLNKADVDLAVGCTYKHLNGGPGSPAFLFVRADLQAELTNPITGWWGHAEPFAFDLDYRPVEGMRKFHTGTMPILSLAAAEPGLEITARAGIKQIRAKSVALTELFIALFDERLAGHGFRLNTPRDQVIRGSHVSISHDHAWKITRALIERMNVIPDFREPDNLRIGFSPLYQSFVDVVTVVDRIEAVMVDGMHNDLPEDRTVVT